MNIKDLFQQVLRIVSASCPGKEPKVLANGVRLFCHQPEIAPQAWLHVVFAPVDLRTIEVTEQRLNTKLPERLQKLSPTDQRPNVVQLQAVSLGSANHDDPTAR